MANHEGPAYNEVEILGARSRDKNLLLGLIRGRRVEGSGDLEIQRGWGAGREGILAVFGTWSPGAGVAGAG